MFIDECYTGESGNLWGRSFDSINFSIILIQNKFYSRTNIGYDSFKLTASRTTRYEALPIEANVTTSYFARQV